MLRRIRLENFKSWRELDIELAPITLVFGVNSSGKTALLQSLLMLKQTAQAFDPGQRIHFGGGPRDFVDFGSYEELAFAHDLRSDIGLHICWDPSSYGRNAHYMYRIRSGDSFDHERYKTNSIEYRATWRYSETIRLENLSYKAQVDGPIRPYVKLAYLDNDSYAIEGPEITELRFQESFRDSEGHSWLQAVVRPPESCYILPQEIQFRYRLQTGFFNRRFEALMEQILYLGPLRRYPLRHYLWTGGKPKVIEPDGGNAIETLIASEQSDRSLLSNVARHLKQLELVDSFNVKPIDASKRLYEITAIITKVEASLVDVGFGVSQVLPVITMLLSAPEGSIVLLEQPELHLHPNAQAALADLMLYAAETRKLQLIVESHSEHVVRRLQRRIAEAEPAFATHDNIKMYFCQPGENGSTIDEVKLDRFGQIRDWPDKFLGDMSGDIHSMSKAAFKRLKEERVGV